jgi:hypothetical protein
MKNQAIINFMYFGHNYPHNFISKVWAGKDCLEENDKYSLARHLEIKFNSMYEQKGTLTFFLWFMEIDNDNKNILINYIDKNYKG